jgi:hypothetical protein
MLAVCSCVGGEVAMANAILVKGKYAAVRRWPRYKVDIPVRVVTRRLTNNIVAAGRGMEINLGGMTVFSLIELTLGDEVGIEFTPPFSGKLVTVRGFVRNCTAHNYGVEFITENDADYASLGQLEAALGKTHC